MLIKKTRWKKIYEFSFPIFSLKTSTDFNGIVSSHYIKSKQERKKEKDPGYKNTTDKTVIYVIIVLTDLKITME